MKSSSALLFLISASCLLSAEAQAGPPLGDGPRPTGSSTGAAAPATAATAAATATATAPSPPTPPAVTEADPDEPPWVAFEPEDLSCPMTFAGKTSSCGAFTVINVSGHDLQLKIRTNRKVFHLDRSSAQLPAGGSMTLAVDFRPETLSGWIRGRAIVTAQRENQIQKSWAEISGRSYLAIMIGVIGLILFAGYSWSIERGRRRSSS